MPISSDPAPRRPLFALCGAAAVALLAGVAVGSSDDGGEPDGAAPPVPTRTPSQPATRAARLPLEQQVGQLLVLSFDGTEAPEYIHRILRQAITCGQSEQGYRYVAEAFHLLTSRRPELLNTVLHRPSLCKRFKTL